MAQRPAECGGGLRRFDNEDITEALWGSKASPAAISELNKKAYVPILAMLDEFSSLGVLDITPTLRKARKRRRRVMIATQYA